MNTFTQSQKKIDNPTPVGGQIAMVLIIIAFMALFVNSMEVDGIKSNTPEIQKSTGSVSEKPQQYPKVVKT